MPLEGTLRDRPAADLRLIETLRWEPDTGFVRLPRHLSRLEASAQALGFACERYLIAAALEAAVSAADCALRIRLTLDSAGTPDVTTQPFVPLAADVVWTVLVATTRLSSDDALLRHKTTRRDLYDRARAEFTRDEADEILLLNERGELCEGTITTVFLDVGRGPLLTPPLACGLLAGVLRTEMLENGKAVEAALGEHDLRSAKAIHVGNSLRGMVRARLR